MFEPATPRQQSPAAANGGMIQRLGNAISDGLSSLVVPTGFRGIWGGSSHEEARGSETEHGEHAGFGDRHTERAEHEEAVGLSRFKMLTAEQIQRGLELVSRGVEHGVYILANIGKTKDYLDYARRQQQFAAHQAEENQETNIIRQTNFFQQLASTFKRLIGQALQRVGLARAQDSSSGSDSTT